MNSKWIYSIIWFLFIVVFLTDGEVNGIEKSFERFSLSVSRLTIEQDERVLGFKVSILNGAVHSIPRIPRGWGMDIDVDPSWKTVLTAHIVLGAAALTKEEINYFNNFLIIERERDQRVPFDIEVEVITSKDLVKEKQLVFKLKELKLRKIKK